uniref:Myotubularin-related protein 13 n=1 Tax=Strigamia maritima TaxID=126957 RepID=T1JDW2_STRMM
SGASIGKILQRFPAKDWDDTPFIEGIELFCQPQGWTLSTAQQQPLFFVSVLTDIDANPHYCACLCFNEAAAITPSRPPDEEDEGDTDSTPPLITHHSIMYAPKCLVLVSRLNYFETFRNCLGIVYTVCVENLPYPMETLIGNILGCVQVPPPGGPQVRFSIGAGDRQALQPPLSMSLPATNSALATLFSQLGIHNVLSLFCAALTEHKLLFHSCSYTRLIEACQALTALLYPFKYSHVYIPLLPAVLVEVLSTPTPFIMGIHSNLRLEINELLDVILIDLDGGSITIPDCISVPSLPPPLYPQTHSILMLVLHPELLAADNTFPSSNTPRPSSPVMLDKEIRAIFLRLFAQLLQGYRSCLNIVRIHSRPFISFHKAAFLGQRNLMDDEFMKKLLNCMFFNTFVSERGPPFRVCDIFDELYANMQDLMKSEGGNQDIILHNIQELAHHLFLNENPNQQPYVQIIPKPTEGAFTRIHQPTFPTMNAKIVQDIIDDGLSKHKLKVQVRPQPTRIIPMGPSLSTSLQEGNIVVNSVRRLEVLRHCIKCIFEGKISDARKTFPAVLRALKNNTARLALCQELCHHVLGNKAILGHQQFELVVRLINCALQDDSSMDEHGIAYALLPLTTAFCRKLCTGVIQFAYTCVQEHAVWTNQQFWEDAFYQDVQKEIRSLYLPRHEVSRSLAAARESALNLDHNKDSVWSRDRFNCSLDYTHRRSVNYVRPQEPSALEIAAEQMRTWDSLTSDQKQEMISNEESTVYSQAIHYANRMVYLRVPLDASKTLKSLLSLEGESNSNSNVTNSVSDQESIDAESGFEEDTSEVGAGIIRFVSRFVDKVCTESGVTEDHIKALHQMIPGVVAMHIETLEAVHRESKRLPPVQKPKIQLPTLLLGEELVADGLRVYLIPDGREEATGGLLGGPALLPSEGAIFLTNYRIVFKGTPCDPFANEQTVIRAFPVASLTKEKRINVQYLSHLDQWLQEGLQLRSSTFQLLKIAFDEEVTSENIESIRKLIHRVRHPESIFSLFAFTSQAIVPQTQLHKQKEKNATLRGLAKKTLLKTARKAGFKPKSSSRRQKYVLPSVQNRSMTIPGRLTASPVEVEPGVRSNSVYEDDLSKDRDVIDESDIIHSAMTSVIQSEAKNVERLSERSYSKDWSRLGLGSINCTSKPRGEQQQFRVTLVNGTYSLCRSYPAVFAVPSSVSDESLRKIARCYRHCRLPMICWRHPRTKALLLRSATFHVKGVMGMLKAHPGSSGSSHDTSSSLEQEKFFQAVVNATPLNEVRQSGWMTDSTLSINSLVLSAGSSAGGLGLDNVYPTFTPEIARRGSNPFTKAMNSLRSSGGRTSKQFTRWGSLKGRRQGSASSVSSEAFRLSSGVSESDVGSDTGGHSFRKAALYVLGDKSQLKGIRPDAFYKCDFVALDCYEVRHLKMAFKKLMRTCVPSAPITNPDQNFLKTLENSEWLHLLKTLLQVSGAVVDLMDVQGSSVLVCMEEGWDVTTQVTSLAQLCLDPFYRTIDGFRVLIEKEWLASGHRFGYRGNHTNATQTSGFAPVFLHFLDAVHQIHHQFPMSFEFNQYYLKFLAYHSVSCRFRTFLLDSECERLETGLIGDERSQRHRGLDSGSDEETHGFAKHNSLSSHGAQSIWDYIDKHCVRSPIFHNFYYAPDPDHPILLPFSNISNLRIWDYYLDEDLRHGPSYELEVDPTGDEENDIPRQSSRRVISSSYDNVQQTIPNAFTNLLEEIHHLEIKAGHLPQKWKVFWDKLELPSTDSLTRQTSFTTQMIRSHGRSVHKRSTIELLVRGKMTGESTPIYAHPHRFEKFNYTSPTYCDHCNKVLWGFVKTGMHCVDCGFNCHEKCLESVPKNCTKYKAIADSGAISNSASKAGSTDSASMGSNMTTSHYYDQFQSNVSENRTHEGYLQKRGAVLKGWKQRWFVLDSIKHQLRYYDSIEDSHCKGFIDLSEVVSVAPAMATPGASKKADEKAFFDLKTIRRSYSFLASDAAAAQEWVEKIQACLQ